MNRKLIALLPGLLLAGACTTMPGATGAPEGCKRPTPEKCTNAPQQVVTLNKGNPTIVPECVRVDSGDVVTIKLVRKPDKPGEPELPPPAAGKVVTMPADSADGWLVGSNGTGGAPLDEIRLTVPAEAVSGKEHKYTLQSNEGDCLDPRVHIN